MKGQCQMNEMNNFENYWQDLMQTLDMMYKLQEQNEELVADNRTLLEQIEKLQKKLNEQEEKIKSLADSERTMNLAKKKIYEANRNSEEAKIQMKKIEHLKSTLEDLINEYYQKLLSLQEQARKNNGE